MKLFAKVKIKTKDCFWNDELLKKENCPDPEERLSFKPALPKSTKDRKIQSAYNTLTKAYCKKNADVNDYTEAMEEAIGYLGEVLE